MKKLGILAIALLAQVSFAQTNRFVYQVTSKPDITNKNDIKTENAYLDISAEKSMFYSENRIKRDSVMQANRQSGGARGFNREQMDGLRTNINYTIEKNKKDQKTFYKERIGRDQYSYEEDRPLNWKILSETRKIGDYKVQKAETDFGGRKWTAWFTTDLPYQDGPYKFNGLPGLVVKAEDSTGDYSFDLMKNYKISDFPEMTTFGNVIKVKRTDYVKQQEKFKADPMSFLGSQRGGGGNSSPRSQGGGGGNGFSPEVRKRIQDGVKDEIKKSSNPIELK
ncbi:GLPGLI family protein [Chryseobacterium indoltheticum]|uniref:GLPGLI family protein n=1 Tax=Chryseobacterium indoltheticum TaxID=254 RepID=A0A381F6X2_9FLAO|nr:GLPGLI family protein [Chryseobacterium indoltheticum]AZA72621.1 GLPGLI family protein [Chryseobacterium indoltheticum]SIQ77074.1 GLPGLI family protein [Chryseobacterium indoltheticum]SUX42204.1 GLPGLI family protein [Chryseobacterium indoltheticum]